MTYPASITLDPQPLRDWRVIPVHHMRRLTLALGELNRLCPDLPDAHPLHAIAGEIRLVVRDAWWADKVIQQNASARASTCTARCCTR